MAAGFLYERITQGRPATMGTLVESEGAPEPRFALQGTVNWMHALDVYSGAASVTNIAVQHWFESQPLVTTQQQSRHHVFNQKDRM